MGHYRSQAEAKKAKEAYNFIDALVKKTPYANLIEAFSSKTQMADTIQRLEELGYSPYSIGGKEDVLRLFVGAFTTKKGAEEQNRSLKAAGIQGQVVER